MTKPKPITDEEWLKCWDMAIEMWAFGISWRRYKKRGLPEWWGRHHSRLVKKLGA